MDKNKITISNNQITKDEINGYILQKHNKKFLGIFRFNIWVYETANQGKDNRVNRWLKKTIGQKPVILDTVQTNTSLKQIKAYLNNKGYFSSHIAKNIKYKKKKAIVNYNIRLSTPYTIRNISYAIRDRMIDSLVTSDIPQSFLKKGDIYNAYTLEDERDRITTFLKNNGFYYFSKEYILFHVDSTLKSHQLNITIDIQDSKKQFANNSNFSETRSHPRCFINSIYIFPDFSPEVGTNVPFDTINSGNNRYFLYKDKLRLKPKSVIRNLFLKKNSPYRMEDVQLTYNRLSGLGVIRFVNFDFSSSPDKKSTVDSTWLDCHIQLTRNPLQRTSYGTEGTNKGGYLGITGYSTYQNINIFRGSEILNLKLKGSLEMQKNLGKSQPSNEFLFFNTIETGIEARFDFPRIVFPVKQERVSKFSSPNTSLTGGFNFQLRPFYKRYITNLSFGYEWKQSQTIAHILSPFEINSVRIFPSSEFTDYLNSLKDPRYKYQYTDHLIMALKYSLIFSNQGQRHQKHFEYFRLNMETSGNSLNLYSKYIDNTRNANGDYTLFNIRYAQYLRSDFDFRYYNAINPRNLIVIRAAAGLGYAYGNSKSLPFEKGFYSGGANGMRGWRIRSLGPGAFRDTSDANFDKMGDILLEGNMEYRFPIYRFLKGAFFADAGNIWTLNTNSDFPDGKFSSSTFINQIAMDAGFGIRLDFSYFIFRIDGAIPIRSPSLPQEDRWIKVPAMQIGDIIWNFAIGYPF
ncbi:MAG: BamA/TamA family outer membrane protein [Lentimicrobiaceae bacterium]|nr:BamA/TamA family outer membrane protein [Lentimicrobiaceae bacterium]